VLVTSLVFFFFSFFLFFDYFAPAVRVHRVQKSSAAIGADKKDYEVG
jgi:hypothetical protein